MLVFRQLLLSIVSRYTFWWAVNEPVFVTRVGVFCCLSRERERESELTTAKPNLLRQRGNVSGTFRFSVEPSGLRVEKYSSQGEPSGSWCVVCKTERKYASSLLCRLRYVVRRGRLFCAVSGCHPITSLLCKKETSISDILHLILRTNSTYWPTGVLKSYVHNSVSLKAIFLACLNLKVSGKVRSVVDMDCIYERQF